MSASVCSAAIRANDRLQRGYRVTGDGKRNPAFAGTVEARMEHADASFELKTINDAGSIEGIAAGIGNVDHGGDRIMPGAFAKTLADRGGRPLPMLLHHDLSRPAGAWTDWKETGDGLYVKGRLSMATRDGQEAHVLATDGALTGISIGYKGSGAIDRSGTRNLTNVELFEASLVTVPMNDRARVTGIKSITSAKDIADLLRYVGLSGRQAKAAAGAAWKAIHDNDDEAAAEAQLDRLFKESAARIAGL